MYRRKYTQNDYIKNFKVAIKKNLLTSLLVRIERIDLYREKYIITKIKRLFLKAVFTSFIGIVFAVAGN